uniref:Uncharacterized protein n=1 Tax=Thermosporothrix sp. COM3 TaxID=2490863 RepID=A0A455SPY6_9CHLR|nr:hypothetical protein KTC_19450 [Thermosporothrix sp. COM3]
MAKQRSGGLILKHVRLRIRDIQQAEALAEQHDRDLNDVVRTLFERGTLFGAALEPPGPAGCYGLYEGRRLAELLLPDLEKLICFVVRYGCIPAMLEHRPSEHPAPLHPPADTPDDIAEEAVEVLNLFFAPPS